MLSSLVRTALAPIALVNVLRDLPHTLESMTDRLAGIDESLARLSIQDGPLDRLVGLEATLRSLSRLEVTLDRLADLNQTLEELAVTTAAVGELAPTIKQLEATVASLDGSIGPLHHSVSNIGRVAGLVPGGRRRARRAQEALGAGAPQVDADAEAEPLD